MISKTQAGLPPWTAGDLVQIVTPRLWIRSLCLLDLSEDAGRWYGSRERLRHVYHTDLALYDTLRGLISVCDQKQYFAFVIFTRDPRDGSTPDYPVKTAIGHAKLQVRVRDGRLSAVPTVVIGDESMSGYFFGIEAVRALNAFSFDALGVSSVNPRIYRENEELLEGALRSGYQECSSGIEPTEGGASRAYVELGLSRDTFQSLRNAGARFGSWEPRARPDSG